MLTVPEPPRRGRRFAGTGATVPVTEILRFLLRNWKVFGPMFVGLGLTSLYAGGIGVWAPTFYQRTYGWSPQQVGYITGLASLATAPIGLTPGRTSISPSAAMPTPISGC